MDKEYTEKYRYERKFSVTQLSYEEVVRIVKCNPAMFSTLHPDRYINNIYFETPGYKSYYETLDGVAKREKYRIRWYGETGPEVLVETQIEIKRREGLLNTKKVFGFPLMDLCKVSATEIKEKIERSSVLPVGYREELISRVPLLINKYKRSYFISSDRKYRLTVDRDIGYKAGKMPEVAVDNSLFYNEQIIVEIKYQIQDDEGASRISSHFPFRLSKNSKFTNGIDIIKSHCLVG